MSEKCKHCGSIWGQRDEEYLPSDIDNHDAIADSQSLREQRRFELVKVTMSGMFSRMDMSSPMYASPVIANRCARLVLETVDAVLDGLETERE